MRENLWWSLKWEFLVESPGEIPGESSRQKSLRNFQTRFPVECQEFPLETSPEILSRRELLLEILSGVPFGDSIENPVEDCSRNFLWGIHWEFSFGILLGNYFGDSTENSICRFCKKFLLGIPSEYLFPLIIALGVLCGDFSRNSFRGISRKSVWDLSMTFFRSFCLELLLESFPEVPFWVFFFYSSL